MKTKDVLAFFGSQKAIAEAIGISPPAVSQWGDEVPQSRRKSVEMAMRLEGVKDVPEKRIA